MAKKKLELGTISGSPRQLALAEFRRRCTNENRVCAKQFRGRKNEVYGPRAEQGPTRSKAKVEGNHLTTNYFHFRLASLLSLHFKSFPHHRSLRCAGGGGAVHPDQSPPLKDSSLRPLSTSHARFNKFLLNLVSGDWRVM